MDAAIPEASRPSEPGHNSRFQRRQITLNDPPHQREIHTEVIVRQTIANAVDVLPRDFRTKLPCRVGELLRRLANDLQLANDSILAHPLRP
jgi:hypothetical protein